MNRHAALLAALVAGTVAVLWTASPASAQASCTVYDAVTDAEITSYPTTAVALAIECDAGTDVTVALDLDATSYPQFRGHIFDPVARPHDPWVTLFPGPDADHAVAWTAVPDSTECFIGTSGPAAGTTCPFPITTTPNPTVTAHVADASAVVLYAEDFASAFTVSGVTVAPYTDPSAPTTTTTTTTAPPLNTDWRNTPAVELVPAVWVAVHLVLFTLGFMLGAP